MAASVVDLPEPVAPTMMTRPRLDMTTSLSTSGRPRSSSLGISLVMVRSTMPTELICTNADTRKRPRSPGLMAKLASLVSSNEAVCLSFMMERARSMVWAAVSTCDDTGVILPSILMAGGKPAVMNRSEPFLLVIRRSRSNMNLEAWSRSMVCPFSRGSCRASWRRCGRRLFLADRCPWRTSSVRHWSSVCMPTVAAGLDRGIHLRDLALADQVTDRRRRRS